MATHRINILDGALPDGTGNCWWKSSAIDDNNDRFPHEVLAFKDSGTRIYGAGKFTIPKNYVGTAKIEGRWKSTATSGAVRWEFDYKAIAAGESLDPSTDDESVGSAETTPGTARVADDFSVALTSANFAVDDTVLYKIARDGTDGSDTLAADALLEELWFTYNDV